MSCRASIVKGNVTTHAYLYFTGSEITHYSQLHITKNI